MFILLLIFSKFTKLYDHHHKSVLEHFISQIRSLIIEDWNAKVGSQETPGVTGKYSNIIFSMRYKSELHFFAIDICRLF